MFSMPFKPLCLKNSPFFFENSAGICPSYLTTPRPVRPSATGAKQKAMQEASGLTLGRDFTADFFLKKRNILEPQKFLWS
jgi:hypothetical protein